jgi:NADPH:quinone reductase-like Zn-dependent oxidoreductase
MKAVRINQWGQPLQIEDIPQPTPGSDEVLIRVHASSLNPIDSIVAAGYLQSMLQVPMTAGTDFAGEVVSVGAEVTHVQPGDAVYGMIPIQGGSFAEYFAPKGALTARKPQSLDFVQAAAVPLPALAAWEAVFDLAQIQAGERVLILGAGGNVGSFAVQLAKNQGAYVIASDAATKADYIQDLGADEVLDSQAQSFDGISPVDVVLNFASEDLVERAYAVIKAGGRYATSLQKTAPEGVDVRGIRGSSIYVKPSTERLAQIAELFDAGKLKVLVSRTFPFSEINEAYAARQSATEPGKIGVTI